MASLFVFLPLLWPFWSNAPSSGESKQPTLGIAAAVSLLASTAVAAWLAWSVSGVPWGVVAYGRHMSTTVSPGNVLYVGEGMNASIAISRLDKVRFFHVSGKVEASSQAEDMRMERMLGHLPALFHPEPRSVLVVGFGAGITAGSFVLYPNIERVVICEIEPLIPPNAGRYFRQENYNVLHDRRVEPVYDDARHYILTTQEKFDVITSDPIHPWVKGTATLYSKEYFELCKQRLNPNGVVTQWVPLYESNLDAVKSEIATFFEVFPSGTIWSNDVDGEGYDVVLVGRTGATRINVDELQQRLDRADHSLVAKSLREVGFRSAVELLATYAGRGSDLKLWLKDAEINRDRNLRLQYLAGMGLNSKGSGPIRNNLLLHRRFPEELFVASSQLKEALRNALGGP